MNSCNIMEGKRLICTCHDALIPHRGDTIDFPPALEMPLCRVVSVIHAVHGNPVNWTATATVHVERIT